MKTNSGTLILKRIFLDRSDHHEFEIKIRIYHRANIRERKIGEAEFYMFYYPGRDWKIYEDTLKILLDKSDPDLIKEISKIIHQTNWTVVDSVEVNI